MSKKYILIFCLISLNLTVLSRELSNFNQFLIVLGHVESSNNPKAYNKSENAIGIYQIRLLYFKDAQQFNPELKKYSHSDCFSPEISKMVVKVYVAHYVKSDAFEDFARCHNSGPQWKNKKHLTNKYWARFKKISVDLNKGKK